MERLLKLAKMSLGIVESSTIIDEKLKLLINAGIEDLKSTGIEVDLSKSLVIQAVIMYVCSNHGSEESIKLSQQTYSSLKQKLSLSSEYRMEE